MFLSPTEDKAHPFLNQGQRDCLIPSCPPIHKHVMSLYQLKTLYTWKNVCVPLQAVMDKWFCPFWNKLIILSTFVLCFIYFTHLFSSSLSSSSLCFSSFSVQLRSEVGPACVCNFYCICLNTVLFRGLFFLFKISFSKNGCRPYGLPFVGSHDIFPYGWSSEEGSVSRNLTDGASLSSIIHSASSFAGQTYSIASHTQGAECGVFVRQGLEALCPSQLLL